MSSPRSACTGSLPSPNPESELREALLCSSSCRLTTLTTQCLPHVDAELKDIDVMPQARLWEGSCHNPSPGASWYHWQHLPEFTAHHHHFEQGRSPSSGDTSFMISLRHACANPQRR